MKRMHLHVNVPDRTRAIGASCCGEAIARSASFAEKCGGAQTMAAAEACC
jgi:hypothetical protein